MGQGISVAVVGAGIVGVSTALWLQREGHRVTLIDREGPAAGASYGNGGVLASAAVVPVTVPGLLAKAPRMLLDPNQPLFLRWRHLPRLAPWLWRYLSHANARETRRIARAIHGVVADSLSEHLALARGTLAERFVVPSDYLYVYRSRQEFRADAFGWSLREELGWQWEELEGPAFHAYDPVFSRELGFAVRFAGHGHITDPAAYLRALAAHFQTEGGRVIRAEVTDIAREAGRVTGVRAGGETIAAEAVVIATGAWSGALTRRLGLNVPLETERGYHLELWEPSAMPRAPVMIAGGKFVVTPMEGRLRLAGVVEFGGLAAGPRRAPVELLRRGARAAMPGLRWKEERVWMGHRPTTADSIPVIGEVPGVKGVWLGFGHHHIGLTAGPRTGRLLAQMVSGRKPNLDVAPYTPARFARQRP
jgi:D-amino-acid dehydrogenase